MAAACLQNTVIKIPAVRSDVSGVSWRTQSSITCHLPTKPRPEQPPGFDEAKAQAVAVIEVWWWRVKNKKVFKILKEAVRSAEHSLTSDIIRKVCPAESELLRDPTMKAKLKFRFGGVDFPPVILFKVFLSGAYGRTRYFSGKKMIQPASNAAEDARQRMGNRKFYDQMLVDACHHQQLRVTDEVDVTTMKEYMQYVATVDETPAYLGGKDNTWRKLNLDALPRQSAMYSVVELLGQAQVTGGLSLERLQSFTRPQIQLEQVEHLKTVSSLSQRGGLGRSVSAPEVKAPSRGSRMARHRVRRMRVTYGSRSPRETEEHTLQGQISPDPHSKPPSLREEMHSDGEQPGQDIDEGDSDLEREASELYQWTQNLSFDDIQ